ncbi:MarR family winged helix-turn-helix transcriptional regulator [Pseudocolwellia agarivorans]|uniref:MarR family winged helix-turn-helix transcriptional regulator n=1 Tax=Pseudocolwellia agarivorans TaxID=1911682 RepID=UPI00098508C1|nr:MarR family winged helix-turn-helix transcriptional regulator [Pseudocolwellia agarivorans]
MIKQYSLDRSLGYNLKRTQHRLRRRMDETLKACGLSTAQNAVLSALMAQPDMTNADLANAAFITPQSMQSVLAGLEKAGYVVRRQDEQHGRRQLARLTPSGEALALQGRQTIVDIETALTKATAPLSEDEALALLYRLQEALDD